MRTLIYCTVCFILVLTFTGASMAQDNNPAAVSRAALTITAAASEGRVRFTAPASVVQIRLETYDSTGKKLFDNEVRGGNVLDWRLQDGQAEPLPDGAYLCVITVKSLSGRITQRVGSVLIANSSASVQASEVSQLTRQQSEAVGPVEENASVLVLKEDDRQTPTVIAHDGVEGIITRGRGPLTFRLGDFFSGKDKEQMRLTEDGNLGIGTSEPKARLDVAGTIGARDGLVFSDGSTLNVNGKGVLTHTSASGRVVPSLAGIGTQNKLAKWVDSSGTLGDSSVTDSAGNVGIGTSTPGFKLNVDTVVNNYGFVHSSTYLGPSFTPATTQLGSYIGSSQSGAAGGWFGTLTNNALHLFVNNGQPSLTVDTTGFVGVGTFTPAQKLTVKTATANYGVIHTDGAVEVGTWVGSGSAGSPAGWFGTRSNHPLRFFTANNAASMTIDTTGNVGIGTTSPTDARLVVDTSVGTAVFGKASTSLYAGVEGVNSAVSGAGVVGKADAAFSVGVIGQSDNGAGVNGISANGFAMRADGNAFQLRDKGGWVKAMLKVDPDGNILNCYNSQNGSSDNGCGFTVARFTSGGYEVFFGFRVDDRFTLITPARAFWFDPVASNSGAYYEFGNTSNSIKVRTYMSGDTQDTRDCEFTIIVF